MDGEGAAGNAQSQPFQIDELPVPALRHLIQFLAWEEHKILQRLCQGMRYFMEQDYGIHAYLPARHSDIWNRSRSGRGYWNFSRFHVQDTTQAFQGLEGKVIRSLEMNEMHPDFNPLPFDTLVQYPWRLRKVDLKYVDVSLILTVLTRCRNLSELHYKTGFQRLLAEGIEPVPIPAEQEELIQFVTQLPQPTFQVDRLTLLSLSLQNGAYDANSDWANVVFLLLSLSQRTLDALRSFRFEITCRHYWNLKDRLQIFACLGQFLAQCPNLCKLAYCSFRPWCFYDELQLNGNVEGDHFETTIGASLQQNVLSGLMQKYGTALLKGVQDPEALGFKGKMIMPIRQIMGEAGTKLRNLQDVSLGWVCRFELELFQILLSALPSPSIRKMDIRDQTGLSFTGRGPELLLAHGQAQYIPLLYRNLEKLCVSRSQALRRMTFDEDDDANGAISLPRMLNKMKALTHLDISPKDEFGSFYSVAMEARNDAEIPDVTFEEIDDVHFQRLQVLKLKGVKMLPQATARLIQLRNLKELVLIVLPEYRHQLFGVNSEDLLRLLGRLRKLERLSVNMIIFPEDEILKAPQLEAFREVGYLELMSRLVRDIEDIYYYDRWRLTQYEFTFNYQHYKDEWYW